eukprot:78371_1
MSSKKSKSKSSKSSHTSTGNGVSDKTTPHTDYNYDPSRIKTSSETSLKGGFSTLVGGFGGYHGTVSNDTLSFDVSQTIDPQIEFCLKRLLKKDSITKLKALEDLSKLFSTLSIDKLEAAASAWAYTFNKLALVNDKRIRENLHLCFTPFCKQIASSKSKWFTPHLRRIFVYWWMHQHDTSPEVVEAAYNSFYASFGRNNTKHWKVVCYVKDVMLNEMQYILDISTTPETLSNHIKKTSKQSKKKGKKSDKKSKKNKASSKDDLERYERAISSTLCGLATLIAKENEIENEQKNESEWFTSYRDLLCNSNLWRFINDRSPLLRNSAYLLCSACLGNKQVAEEILPFISSTLFRCMSETHVANMDNLWTALLGMIQYTNCWKYAKKKSFIIRLSNLVQVDIFVACKYIRSLLLFIPADYLFELSVVHEKKKKKKKNDEDNTYPICKILKAIWNGALNISHLSKRFKAVTMIYFKVILQLLLKDNNAKCEDNNDHDHNIVIDTACKQYIVKENVIGLVSKSLKDLDCPSLFFALLGEHFMPNVMEYDNGIIVESVNCIFSSLQSEFIEPFTDLMILVTDETVDEDEQQEIADKTEDFVADYESGLHKISAFVIHLKPFLGIHSIQQCLCDLLTEIWDFQSSIELISASHKKNSIQEEMDDQMDIAGDIDSDSEHEQDDEIQINFHELCVQNPYAMSFNVCKVSFDVIQNIVEILSLRELESLLNQEIMEGIQYILSQLQTKIPVQYSSGLMACYLKITNTILNKDKENDSHWQMFLQQISNHEWSLKNISVFIDTILLPNAEYIIHNKAVLVLFESFLTNWISTFLKHSYNHITIPAESYTSLIVSLQGVLGGTHCISSKCLLSILSLIMDYLDAAIEMARTPHSKDVSFTGITNNKTHCVIRSLSRFLEYKWTTEDHELSQYQLLIVSKLFTLCFAREDSGDPHNIATICEYMFKKIIRYHHDLYGELLIAIAKTLRLPWYFTSQSMDNDIDGIPIVINHTPSRWRWCVQCLLLIQSTSFEHGLNLINIILDRTDIESVFSCALSDENGVSLSTLQRVRDVVCDLCDLIGMDLVLYAPSDNSHFPLLSEQQTAYCHREWLVCWLLAFEEKRSWIPGDNTLDASVMEHTKQWKIDHAKEQSQPSAHDLFAKPRAFSSVFQSKLMIQNSKNKGKRLFIIPQRFVDKCIVSCFECKECPVAIRSRVIGYFVNALNDRLAIYNYHDARYLDDGLRTFVSNVFTADTDTDKKEDNAHAYDATNMDDIQMIQSVFVMFPDLIPISFIRHLITLSTACRVKISALTTNRDESDESSIEGEAIIQELKLLYALLCPIHGIALNITGEYKSYPSSMIWSKNIHRELLVGTLFELFLYVNGSFEWMLQRQISNDLSFWFSNSLTLISHSLIGMNSEGDEDVFFELDWSSFVFVTNFVMDHILHEGVMDTDAEYRYHMMALWHCMAVLRQIALRSTDLSGRKNLKTKKNKSFIFESLELLTEIVGNETWRNRLSSEALASPFHKLALQELEVEELVYISQTNTHCYAEHAVLDELYQSIHDLLNHPIVSLDKLSSILESWHMPLFDALRSSHHQIVASAFRILCISTRYQVLQNMDLFSTKPDDKSNDSQIINLNDDDDEDDMESMDEDKQFERINNIIDRVIPTVYLLPHNTRSIVSCHELRSWFLCWYLLMNLVQEVPLEFKLEIVQSMKHDDKYNSPLGSYALALREIIEHVYVAPSLSLLMTHYVTKTTQCASFPFDLSDFVSNKPSDDPNISANMLSRCRWLHNLTGNVLDKNIFFSPLAIRVYNRFLSYFPALCRYWATNDVKDRVTRNIVSAITSSQLSPIILRNTFNSKKLNRALKALRRSNYSLEDAFRLDEDVVLKLKCNAQSREVEALYIADEVSISMCILFPFDYPLKGVTFEWRETCGLPPKKVKNWKMLLMGMVNNQNASITEAFMLLAVNISKHYEGIDECPICYSVVHPTKKTLPKVKCTTCKGKFHRYCIYKWTKTSQKSSCPLCRSLI